MNVFELQASISLQTQQFVNAIRQAIENGNKLNDNLKKMRQPTEDEQKQLDALKNRLEMSKDATSKAADKVKELTEKFNESAKETGLTSEETKKYAKELEDAEKQLERSQKSEERVTRQLEELEHSLEETTDDVDELGDQSEKSGDKVSMFGEVLKANLASEAIKAGLNFTIEALKQIGSAVGGFIKSSVQEGMAFDSAMSRVSATMGMSMDQMLQQTGSVELAWGTFTGNLRDFAKEMGANTAFTATQAADALNYMALAGYDVQTSMTMLPNVMSLAAAGGFDLARASDMVTDTQTAFGLSLGRTSVMVDEMAKAASTGNTNVEQLGDAFLTVGGLAKELNGGFVTLKDGTQKEVDGLQELEIALVGMANAGIKGSEAGTHMRNMLTKLSGPTDEGTLLLESMGVAVFDTEGKMRSLSDIFGELNESMGKMTQQEKIQAITKLFNARDLSSAEALLGAIDQDWDRIGESILNASYNFSEVNEALKNSGVQWEKYEETAWMANGGIAELTDQIKYNLADQQLSVEETADFIASEYDLAAQDAIAAVQAVNDTLNAKSSANSMAEEQLNNLSGAITYFESALSGAKLAISDGISPELTAFVRLGTQQLTELTNVFNKEGISGVIDKMPDIFNQWIDAITDFVSNMAEKIDISKVLTSIAKALTTIIGQIPGIIKNVIPQLLAGAIEAADIIVNGFFDTINELFTPQNMTGFFTSLLDIIGKLGEFIGKNVGGLIDAAVAIVDALAESFDSPEVVTKIFDTAASLVRSLVDGLTGGNHLQKLLDAALNITLMMQKVFMEPNVIESVTEAAAIIVSELAKGILQALPQIANSLAGFAKNVVDYIISYDWSAAADGFVSGFMAGFDLMDWSFLDDVEQKWVDFWDSIVNYWRPVYDKWVGFWEGFGEYLYDAIHKIIKSIANFFSEIWNNYLDFWGNIGGKLYDEIENIAAKLDQWWSDIATKTANMVSDVLAWFQNIPDKLSQMASDAWKWGSDMLQNFISGIRSKLPDLSSIVSSGVAGKIANLIGHSHPKEGPLAKDYTWMPDMMQLFADGIRDNAGKVEDEITSLAESMRPDLDYTATVSAGYGSVSPYSAYTGASAAGVSPSIETIVSLLNGILVATQAGHYVSVSDIDTSLGRRQAAEIRRGI